MSLRFHRLIGCVIAVSLSGLPLGSVIAQPEPPSRVARLNHTEGRIRYSAAGVTDWADADLNRPLVRGDRLRADPGTRGEIQIGSTVLRMDGGTRLEVLAMDNDTARLAVTQGSVQLQVRNLPEGENLEIDTPNLAWRAAYPGEVRVDVDGKGGQTRVTVRSGAGALHGERGEVLLPGAGQQVTLRGRSLEQVASQDSPPQDNFDRWAAERERRDEQSLAAHYVPRELVGYQWLDGYGQWGQDPTYGAVWFPNAVAAGWAPYRLGRWSWIAPWGWTWIDEAPWAFAPSHYGRWAIVGARWAWVPGRLAARPAYAPALVAFVGGPGSTPLTIAGKSSVVWFPLAPGEPWQSAKPADPYVEGVNANTRPPPSAGYAYQHKLEAFTGMAADDFARGKPLRESRLSVAASMAAQAQVVPPPKKPAGVAEQAAAQQATAQRQATIEEIGMVERERIAQQQKPAQPRVAQPRAQQAKSVRTKGDPGAARGAGPARASQQMRAGQRPRQSTAQRHAKATAAPGGQQVRRAPLPSGNAAAAATRKPAQDRSSHAQEVEASADGKAQQLRVQREAAVQRRAQQQERARREALRQQQALGE